MRRLLTLALIGAFSACHTPSDVKKDEVVNSQPRSIVALRRTMCFGRCPVYRVEVFEDGRVRFAGEKNVKVTEPVEAMLPADQLAALKARLANPGFKWADYVKMGATDMASVELTVGDKTLKHYLGDDTAPEALVKFEDDVDALIGTKQWIDGSGAPLQ